MRSSRRDIGAPWVSAWGGAGVAAGLRAWQRGYGDYTCECAARQPARHGGPRLLGHRPHACAGYAIGPATAALITPAALRLQNQKRPPVWAAVKEGVARGAYLRASGERLV